MGINESPPTFSTLTPFMTAPHPPAPFVNNGTITHFVPASPTNRLQQICVTESTVASARSSAQGIKVYYDNLQQQFGGALTPSDLASLAVTCHHNQEQLKFQQQSEDRKLYVDIVYKEKKIENKASDKQKDRAEYWLKALDTECQESLTKAFNAVPQSCGAFLASRIFVWAYQARQKGFHGIMGEIWQLWFDCPQEEGPSSYWSSWFPSMNVECYLQAIITGMVMLFAMAFLLNLPKEFTAALFVACIVFLAFTTIEFIAIVAVGCTIATSLLFLMIRHHKNMGANHITGDKPNIKAAQEAMLQMQNLEACFYLIPPAVFLGLLAKK